MSLVVTNTFQNSITPGSFASLGFTGTAGRSFLLVAFQSNADLITGIVDDVGNTYPQDASLDIGGNGRRAFRCQTISGAPTQIKVNVSSGTQSVHLSLVECVGLATSGAFESLTTVNVSSTTSHILAYTTASANALALATIGYGGDAGTPTGTGGWTAFAHTTVERDGLYIADTGAAGSKNLTFTTSTAQQSFAFIVVYKFDTSIPTVTSVTSSGVTEGGNMVFTVSLSGATSGSTNYAFSLGGTATAGTDYTSPLTSGMCSNGVTVAGGNFTAPNAVLSWTVTIPTTQDALDEDNETIVLTVGGVASTWGSITDDDAPPVVTFSDGVESFGVVTCVATLGAVSGKDVSFQVDTANGTKTAGTHYTAIVAQTVTIPSGSLTAAITVNTL